MAMKIKKNSQNNMYQILLAEDSPTQAEQLRYLLEKHHYKVIVAKDGKEALEMVFEHKPSLIISDIVMPGMNGYDLCKEIKSDESTMDIPVILLTSLSNSEDVLEGISCGADNFITKPYQEDYLISHIEQILANRRINTNERVRVGVEILFGGKKRFITASQQQMLTLLISTYEAAVQRNNELIQTQDELKKINDNLEGIVIERTTDLYEEIADREKKERQVVKLNHIYALLSNINQAIVRIKDKEQLLNDACTIAVEKGKFQSAWIGIVNNETLKIETTASAGLTNDLMTVKRDKNPVLMVLETGKHFISNNINEDGNISRIWKQKCVSSGFRSFAVFPVKVLGKVTGSYCIYSNEVGFFDEPEINLLDEMSTDISFTLEYIQKEKERKLAAEALNDSEQRYRRLFEAAKDGILILNAESGTIVDINPFLVNLLGYPIDQIREKKVWEIGMFSDKFDSKANFLELQQKEYIRYDNLPLKTSDGRQIAVEFVSNVYQVNHIKVIQCNIRDITERKLADEKIRASELKYKQLFDDDLTGDFITSLDGTILLCNLSMAKIFGFESVDELINKNIITFYKEPESREQFLNLLNKNKKIEQLEQEYILHDGSVISVIENIIGEFDKNGRLVQIKGYIFDNTKRKRAEERQNLTAKILTILNRPNEWQELIKDILTEINTYTGFEAIGIRLKEGEDYPYFETIGFSPEFVEKERYLCTRDMDGNIICDSKGNPFLECMCGKIISKLTDPALPYYTPGGSFWSNYTTHLMATSTENNFKNCTRLRVNEKGYESAALIPLHSGDEIIGLLQLNDKRTNRFTSDLIQYFEELGTTIGIAFKKMHYEKRIKESEERFRSVLQSANDAIITINNKGIISGWNTGAEKIFGYKEEDITGKDLEILMPLHYIEQQKNSLKQVVQSGIHQVIGKTAELIGLRNNGDNFPIELSLAEWETASGKYYTGIIRDITERKLVEEALYESEMKNRTLVTNSPDGIFVVDLSGTFLSVNKTMCDNLKYTEKELLSMKIWDIVPSKYLSLHKERLATILKGEINEAAEYEVIGKDGIVHYIEVRSALYYKDKKIIGFQGIARDITERMQTEDALRESEKNYRELIDGMNETVWVIDFNGNLIDVNKTAVKVLGYSKKELLGIGLYGIDSTLKKENIIALAKAMPTDELHIFETSHTAKNGRTFPVEVYSSLVTYQGKQLILSIARDITERRLAVEALKTSEEKFRSIFDNASDGMFLLDVKTRKFIINNAACSMMLGYSDDEFLNLDIAAIHPSDELQDIFEQIEKILRGEEGERGDVKFKRKDGTVFTADLSSTLVTIAGKRLVLVIFRDITERLHTETQLRLAKEKAEESDRLKTAFLHNISHEIRTPLNGIIGFTDILIRPDLSTEKREQFSKIIHESSDQLLSIVNDIISMATIEAGHEILNEKASDINNILKLIKTQHAVRAETKNLSFTVSSALTDHEATILVDETKLLQILTNLLSNAIKFTTEGYINLNCRLNENDIEFIVEDSGIGIPSEMQDKIFDRFFQIDYSDTRLYGGTGLGLSIVKSYIHFLNGEVRLDSKPGKGSVFIISIPYRPVKQPKPVKIPTHEDFKQLGHQTLLIAEDEIENFELFKEYISDLNLTVIYAANGLEAVKACKENPSISLVLMDVKMPQMDGYEASRQIKSFRPELPIIIQSAYIFQNEREKSMSTYIDGFIEKPINKVLLLETIYKHM